MSASDEANKARASIEAGELDGKLSKHIQQTVIDAVRNSFDQRRETLISALMQRLGAVPHSGHGNVAAVPTSAAPWVDIESLSRLRSVVGGRFENLKKRWVDAGFPLREHRGDKEKDYKVDQGGWDELAGWLLKHGFESRLTPDSLVALFQVREIGAKGNAASGVKA
ncbi:MAG: hypothetical protein K1X79_13875 [Oligoflexia bacterium]|nr:hypothetical protein [Oligoflexia bacterium]